MKRRRLIIFELIAIFCYIQLSEARVTVFDPNINALISEHYPCPEMVYGLSNFTIQGRPIEVLDPIDGCTTIKDDIKGKIAIIQYDGDLCYPDIVMRNVLDAGASGLIMSRKRFSSLSYITSSFIFELIPLAAVNMPVEDFETLLNESRTNPNIILQITSGDYNLYADLVSRGTFWFLQVFLCLLSVLALIYAIYKLSFYVRVYGHQFSVSQVCLSMHIISAFGTFFMPLPAIFDVYVTPMADGLVSAINVFGPAYMVTATVLVGCFWSGVVFQKQKRKFWNKKLFAGVLTGLTGVIVLYSLFSWKLLVAATPVLAVIIVIGLASAVYFIVMGIKLIVTIAKTKAKLRLTRDTVPKRLVILASLNGLSVLAFVISSALVLSPSYTCCEDSRAAIVAMVDFWTLISLFLQISMFKSIRGKSSTYQMSTSKNSQKQHSKSALAALHQSMNSAR
jgi:hypothetical protein